MATKLLVFVVYITLYHYPFVVGHHRSSILHSLSHIIFPRPFPSDFTRVRGKFLGKSGVPMPAIWSKQWVDLAEGKYFLHLSAQV